MWKRLILLIASVVLPLSCWGADVPDLVLEYTTGPLPCFVQAQSTPAGERIHLVDTTAEVSLSTSFHVSHGWGTLCWESFPDTDGSAVAEFTVANAEFILLLNGQRVHPTYLNVYPEDCSSSSPDYCCGGSDTGDWGWNIAWAYEFLAGSLIPGVHILEGRWEWTGSEMRVGPYPNTLMPASIIRVVTLTVLP